MIDKLMQRLHRPVYAARLNALVSLIWPHLRPGDRVLDVGCGFGALGKALMADPNCPDEVQVTGLERHRRDENLIEVHSYDGGLMPFGNDSFDLVILADVLHHEEEPHLLIEQCIRVCRRLLIIKDHKIDGPLARQRIGLIDWAANAPYGVRCLYRYNTIAQWHQCFQHHSLGIVDEKKAIDLYPLIYNLLFGRRLQYFSVLEVAAQAQDEANTPT